MNTKKIVYVIVGIIVAIAIFFIGKSYGTTTITSNVGAVGDFNQTPTSYSVQADPSGATFGYISADNKYEWASMSNSSGRDRFVSSIEYGCIGLTTVSTSTTSIIPLTIATSTTAALGLNGNTNFIVNGIAIATSSAWYFQTGSSTPFGSVASFATGVTRIWPTSTVLNLESSATSSASCWLRVNTLTQ